MIWVSPNSADMGNLLLGLNPGARVVQIGPRQHSLRPAVGENGVGERRVIFDVLLNGEVVGLSLQVAKLQYFEHPPHQPYQAVEQQQDGERANGIAEAHVGGAAALAPDADHAQE